MVESGLNVEMALDAAAELLLQSEVMVKRVLPVGERRQGRWAAAAQLVVAEEESPIIAVRREDIAFLFFLLYMEYFRVDSSTGVEFFD
jgi:hypothetical protein